MPLATTDASKHLTGILGDNPYFTAGFGLIGVGAALGLARQGGMRVLTALQRRYLTTLELNSRDPSYSAVLQWLTRHSLRSGNHFSAQTVHASQETSSVRLVPSPGIHYLHWAGHWIKINREREKTALASLTDGQPFETIQFTMLGRRFDVFQQMLTEAQQEAQERTDGLLVLYTAFAAEWRPFGNPRRRRPLSSVILKAGLADSIMRDIREFLASGKWYQDRGIPYRRGYLLHGPPGTGKSSLVQAIASELGYGICLLNLADGMVTDDRLTHLLNALPPRTILLLEDVDSVSVDATSSSDSATLKGFQRLTLSGLLNALDGVGSSEERLIFMTSNHPERLAPVLVRPGRVDLQLKIDLADAEQAKRMFLRFYPDQELLVDRFVEAFGNRPISPAIIQGHFIEHKADPEGAVCAACKLLS